MEGDVRTSHREVLERNNPKHLAATTRPQRGAGTQQHRGTSQRRQYAQTDGRRRARVTRRRAGRQRAEAFYSHDVHAARCWNATMPRYVVVTVKCVDRWKETCARHTEKCWNATTRSTSWLPRARSEVLERNDTAVRGRNDNMRRQME